MTNEEMWMNIQGILQKGELKGKTTPLNEKLTQWIQTKKDSGEIAKITADKYESLTRNHIIPYFTSVTVADVTREQLQEFIVALRKKGLADKTVLEIIRAILSPFFRDMVEDNYIEKSPATRLRLPKINRSKRKPAISPEEIRALLDAIPKSDPWYISILLLAYTGMRRSELLGLAWEDVDLDKGTLYIHQTNVNTYKEKTQVKDSTKTEAGTRTVAIPSILIPLLRDQKEIIQGNASPWVISQRRKGATGLVNPNNYARWLRERMTKAGITRKLSAHSFRHYNITASINAGASQVDIMANVGHKDTRMTSFYIDESQRMQARQEVQNKCANYISDSIGTAI